MGGRTHAQQFANSTFASRVYADPAGTLASIVADPAALAAIWDEAGAELPPIARAPATGLSATVEPVGRYAIAIVTLPAPREATDPAFIAVIGRGDGTTRLTTVGYYTLELAQYGEGTPTFAIHTISVAGARARTADGPLPDPRWFGEHVIELYSGRLPGANTNLPVLPYWYWWLAFDGASAFRMFNTARDDGERYDAVRKAPILLMAEIATAVETYSGEAYAAKLRELRPLLRRDPKLADAWKAAINQLVSSKHAPLATNIYVALPLVLEAREHGALVTAEAYEIEASLRGTLAGLGVDAHQNSMVAHQLHAAAQEALAPRARRGSVVPAPVEDPMGKPLFLDATDVPDHQAVEHNDTFAAVDPTFLAHGGLRAGYVTWAAPEWSAMAQLIDARWVLRTPIAAAHFMAAIAPVLGEGLPHAPGPKIGDQVLAFAEDSGRVRRTQIIAVRVGRVVIRLKAVEGMEAAASRQMLHAQMLYPLAGKAAMRAHTAQLRYWLAVDFATNSLATLVHTPGHDVSRLLPKYPLLAFSELPDALRLRADDRRVELEEELAAQFALEDDPKKREAARAAANKEVEKFRTAADTLANYQIQLRAHRWASYREAMVNLTRALLALDVGNPRVNAAYAHQIVGELGVIDNDPVWAQLDAICRSRW